MLDKFVICSVNNVTADVFGIRDTDKGLLCESTVVILHNLIVHFIYDLAYVVLGKIRFNSRIFKLGSNFVIKFFGYGVGIRVFISEL